MTGNLSWRKSSYSGDEGGNCLEVAAVPDAVRVRDSQRPHGPFLSCRPAAWAAWAAWAATPVPAGRSRPGQGVLRGAGRPSQGTQGPSISSPSAS
jgi:hypothetical protein